MQTLFGSLRKNNRLSVIAVVAGLFVIGLLIGSRVACPVSPTLFFQQFVC